MLGALGSASCDITHETGGTISSGHGHWVLHLVISHTRHWVPFVTDIGGCILRYHTRDRGYDLLRTLGSAYCDILHETGSTTCFVHWALLLVILPTRQGVRYVSGIGNEFCIW